MKISKFLRNFGSLYVWGEGKYLGHNKPPGTKLFTPKRIEKTGDNQDFNEDVIYVSTGPSHCGFITSSGDVYTFGKNNHLQLGHTSNFTLGPMKVPSVPPMKQIECGELHTIALSESGEVYSWGYASSQNPLRKIFKWRSRNTLGYFSENKAELPKKNRCNPGPYHRNCFRKPALFSLNWWRQHLCMRK
ncbi:unnamed protein product [Blepharisma stoltei]|uniref:Uncharacterized protein n=1 Tax=Blepharisma stoltei TaxID=1481888 RepID=A0AAU9K9N6_9CILI|nr:unnamed protein product [Blepharisma stoltei]